MSAKLTFIIYHDKFCICPKYLDFSQNIEIAHSKPIPFIFLQDVGKLEITDQTMEIYLFAYLEGMFSTTNST